MNGPDQGQRELIEMLIHDMKSPLTVMLIELGMLGRWKNSGEARFDEGVGRLTRNCEELIEMIQNLLDLIRIEKGSLEIHPRPVAIGGVLLTALESPPRPIISKGIRVERQLSDLETVIEADAGLIGRAYLTLFKVTALLIGKGERLTVDCGCIEKSFRVVFRGPGDRAHESAIPSLLVGDAHEGWRSLGVDAGTGIGLNLSRSIVESHQGRLRVGMDSSGEISASLSLPALPSS